VDCHRLAASVVVVGFDGTEPPMEVVELNRQGVAGAILFRRNVASPVQIAELCAELKRAAERPYLLCVDQEGGAVARLRGPPFTEVPSMRRLGERCDEALARDVGRLLAREVRAAGIDVNFAPVLDVDTNPANPVIGDRSLSRDPSVVARLGVALAQAMESEGVASCGKHFPGHGDTSQDSHLTLPRLPHGMERLEQVELVPFKAYARAKLASLMTAHVVFEALDSGVPATFSEEAQTGLVRRKLGFEGVLISDDLEMKAISDHHGMDEAAVRSILAGVDLLLVCRQADRQQRAIDGLAREAGRSPSFQARLSEAAGRVALLASRFARGPADPKSGLAALDSAEHRSLVERVMRADAVSAVDPTESGTTA
jgi:beta-N-acetylhexosaminidase